MSFPLSLLSSSSVNSWKLRGRILVTFLQVSYMWQGVTSSSWWLLFVMCMKQTSALSPKEILPVLAQSLRSSREFMNCCRLAIRYLYSCVKMCTHTKSDLLETSHIDSPSCCSCVQFVRSWKCCMKYQKHLRPWLRRWADYQRSLTGPEARSTRYVSECSHTQSHNQRKFIHQNL